MWLFTRHGFFSIVRHGDELAIRTRDPQHLRNLIDFMKSNGDWASAPKIVELPKSDYRWRTHIPADDSGPLFSALGNDINYGNFKQECFNRQRGHDDLGRRYVQALHDIWSWLRNIQDHVVTAKKRSQR